MTSSNIAFLIAVNEKTFCASCDVAINCKTHLSLRLRTSTSFQMAAVRGSLLVHDLYRKLRPDIAELEDAMMMEEDLSTVEIDDSSGFENISEKN